MRKIGNLCVLIGIIIIAVPIIGRIYLQHKQEVMYKEYLKTLEQTIVVPTEEPKIVPEIDLNLVGEMEKAPASINYADYEGIEEKTVLGKIKISSIDVDLLLVEGDSSGALKLGAGHMPDTAFPGQTGNCVIAGHRNYTFGSMFNRLDEVKEGDLVEIEFGGNEYTYKVTKTSIVEPSDLSVIEQSKETTELTLITCHPVYSASHRFIIKAELT